MQKYGQKIAKFWPTLLLLPFLVKPYKQKKTRNKSGPFCVSAVLASQLTYTQSQQNNRKNVY